MPQLNPDDETAGAIEECLDEIDEFIGTLQRFSDPVIAESLRVHLAVLLRAMVESNQCTSSDVQEFATALAQEALEVTDETGEGAEEA
jgi:hypothetical protein